jgi:hypothetical protein
MISGGKGFGNSAAGAAYAAWVVPMASEAATPKVVARRMFIVIS